MNDDRQHMRLLLAARLSSKTGIGIETQDEYGRKWAENQGHTVIDTAKDKKSGMVAPWDRPGLKPWVTRPELMAKYDGILAYKNDRLSRGAWDDETRIRQWASENGKVLVIVDGPQWPPRDDGDFWSWTAQAKQANAEWVEIQERNKRARRKLIETGALVGQVPTWAFTIIGEEYEKQAVATEAGRKYIPEIFQRIADGDSLAAVAAWTRSERVGSGKISASTVKKIINNRIYMGDRLFTFEGGKVTLKVEPLVDATLWKRANKRLANAPVGRRTPVTGDSALLTGSLFCSHCPTYSIATHEPNPLAPMYRIPAGRKPHVHYYYRCAGHYPDRKGCGNMVDLAWLDSQFDEAMSADHRHPVEYKLREGINYDMDLERVILELDDLPKRKLSDAEEDAERRRLRAERDRLEELNRHAEPDRWEPRQADDTYAERWQAADYAGRRAIVKELRITFQWSDEHEPMVTIGPLWNQSATESS